MTATLVQDHQIHPSNSNAKGGADIPGKGIEIVSPKPSKLNPFLGEKLAKDPGRGAERFDQLF